MKKKILAFIISAVFALALASCGEYDESDGIYMDIYTEGWQYKSGSFTYSAEEVEVIDVEWRKGDINIVKGSGKLLNVKESGENLSKEKKVHHMIDGNALKIKFWESGYFGKAEESEKQLTIEVPSGISLKVKNTYGNIISDSLAADYFDMQSEGGSITLGALEAKETILFSETGDIICESVTSESVKATTSSGDISLTDVEAGQADIENKSGEMRINAFSADEATLTSKSGLISVGETKVKELTINSNVSDVELGMSAGGAKITFTSLGEIFIKSDLVLKKKQEEYILGDGKCVISVSLATGNLTVK